MKETKLETVGTFLDRFAADAAVAALGAAGIEAITRQDDCGSLRPQLWLSGVDVVVRSEDAERAREILSIAAAEDPEGAGG